MMHKETIRVHNVDGSAIDITKRSRTRTDIWGNTHTDVYVDKVHKTKEQLEDESKANLIAGGIIIGGTLLISAISAIFGSDDK